MFGVSVVLLFTVQPTVLHAVDWLFIKMWNTLLVGCTCQLEWWIHYQSPLPPATLPHISSSLCMHEGAEHCLFWTLTYVEATSIQTLFRGRARSECCTTRPPRDIIHTHFGRVMPRYSSEQTGFHSSVIENLRRSSEHGVYVFCLSALVHSSIEAW